MKSLRKQHVVIAAFVMVAVTFGAFFWLKMPYGFAPQRQLATLFIVHVNEGAFEKAFALTQKTAYTGETLEAFKNRAILEIGGPGYQFAYAYPPQTNGNRLRRWLRGAEVEMRDVSLEFRGPSDLRITLRHLGNNQWKIVYFTTHAG